MGSNDIACTKCAFASSDARANGVFRYRLASGREIDVSRTLGWCFTCNNLEAIESSQSLAEYFGEMRAYLDQLRSLGMPSFWQHLRGEWYLRSSSAVDSISENLDALEYYSGRTRKLRCLRCGGCSHMKIEFPSALSEGVLITDIRHPDCEGWLTIAPSEIRLNFKSEPKIYDELGLAL